MKKIVGSLCLLLMVSNLMAQKKEMVHSIIVEWHEVDWYKSQEKLWKADIDKNKKDAEAWINYYSAVRALRNCSDDSKERGFYNELGHQIAKDLMKALPESFEANYVMYWDSGLGNSDEKNLKKAYELRPNDPRVLLDYLILSELKRDKLMFTNTAKKLFEMNRMPVGAINWAYNVLTEVSENGIVFTAGDNDTYALWITQEGMNYRKDVTVINTSLIQMGDYRSKIFTEKGISPFNWAPESMSEHAIFQHIFSNSVNIPVHVSTSASGQFNDSIILDHLYLTGLTYIYSDKIVDNVSVLKRNFEKKFLLDHLTRTFSYSIGDLDSRIKYMYVPGLIKLYQNAKAVEDLEGISRYKNLLESIGAELHIESEIQKAMTE
jgi:hypothetical protein